jgi:hypothetical protein
MLVIRTAAAIAQIERIESGYMTLLTRKHDLHRRIMIGRGSTPSSGSVKLRLRFGVLTVAADRGSYSASAAMPDAARCVRAFRSMNPDRHGGVTRAHDSGPF